MPMPAPHTLSADDVYALTAYILSQNDVVPNEFVADQNAQSRQLHMGQNRVTETPVTDHSLTKSAMLPTAALVLAFSAFVAAGTAQAQSAAAEGQKLAFDRGKGNCLTCHAIKGGTLPGSIGPELIDIKSKYPNRADLVAIVSDETLRNPLTVMPPFGRNRILTPKEIDAVVDFLQTL